MKKHHYLLVVLASIPLALFVVTYPFTVHSTIIGMDETVREWRHSFEVHPGKPGELEAGSAPFGLGVLHIQIDRTFHVALNYHLLIALYHAIPILLLLPSNILLILAVRSKKRLYVAGAYITLVLGIVLIIRFLDSQRIVVY